MSSSHCPLLSFNSFNESLIFWLSVDRWQQFDQFQKSNNFISLRYFKTVFFTYRKLNWHTSPRPAMTTQGRHFDFFHSAAGRLLFAAAAVIVLLFFVFTYVVPLFVW
jgi:hypothetical protein